MDTLRYVVALCLVVGLLPSLSIWLFLHPCIGFWRRLGAARTYAIVLSLILVEMIVIALFRRRLLAIEFGTRWTLVVAGVLCLGVAVWMRLWIRRELASSTILGVPEVAPGKHAVRLVTAGPYARVRHPRYLQVLVGALGYSLVANYLAAYVVTSLSAVLLYVVVRLEEKELRQRFGPEYEAYCERVPRFVPHRRRAVTP